MSLPACSRSLVVIGLVASIVVGCSAPGPEASPTPRPPRDVSITVVDRMNQEPVPNATLRSGVATAITGADGTAVLRTTGGASVEASADGFDAGTGTVPDEKGMTIELRPNVVTGTVTDGDGKPITGVRVFLQGAAQPAVTDARGRYSLPGVPQQGTLVYKMPGYRLGLIPIDADMTKDVALTAFVARALYAPSAVFEAAGRLDAMLDLIDRTEVNAMVIDVKETAGNLYWATDLPAATAVGSVMEHPLFQLDEVLPKLKERGI
jgi:hypothetical protein